jgi:formate dehydrogenase subunit delta
VSSAKIEKLARMANQIGDFFAAFPEAEGVAGAANHLKRFWTPKMIGELIEHASRPNSGLNAIAERAVAKLRTEL